MSLLLENDRILCEPKDVIKLINENKKHIDPELLNTMKMNAIELFALYEADVFEPDSKEELIAKSILTITHVLDELTKEEKDE